MNSSLYIHVPFCRRLCGYCDFYKTISTARRADYLHAVADEMCCRRKELNGTVLRTVYFGGGTPSVLTPDEIARLIDLARHLWGFDNVDEITVEANPDDLTPEYLEALASTGCNRLSMGVQSFIDRDLTFMNRRHNAAGALKAIADAREAGFKNISIDLIYGLPAMTPQEWSTNIAMAVDLGVEHISAYSLTVEPNTLFAKRGVVAADEATVEAEYLMLHERLTAAGYEHYEISNFARAGFRSRHNSGYWAGQPYLGIGPAAHSYDGCSRRSWNAASLTQYLAGAEPQSETLTDDTRREEYVMVRLRTCRGIDMADFERSFGRTAAERLQAKAERYISSGVLRYVEGRLCFDARHWLVSDSVIVDFFD